MPISYDGAVDEMYSLFLAQWRQNSILIVQDIPEVRFRGFLDKEKPPRDKYWGRLSTQNMNTPQTSLSTCVENVSASRYTNYGLIFFQLFCPKSEPLGLDNGRKLAEVAANAFRGKSTEGGVWFRNSRVNDLPDDDLSYRFNIVAEYEHDQIVQGN